MKSKGIIDGIDDLRNRKIPFNRSGIRIGTAVQEYYLREISGGIRNFYPIKFCQHLYDSLLSGVIDADGLTDIGSGEYIVNNVYCNLTLGGKGFDKNVFDIVTPKQWLYVTDLAVNILVLRESGVLESLKLK
ncbi:hypothetical protein I4U23_005334 [Adineta vaga]|nr:hypothetical protein I4U23_005334 [Adineta vaga]